MVNMMGGNRENIKQLDQNLESSFPRQDQHTDHKRQNDHQVTFLVFSMGVFVCITASLTMVTVISNIAISYQSRGLLLEIFDQLSEGTEKQGQNVTVTPMPSTTSSLRSTFTTEHILSSSTIAYPNTTVTSEPTAQSSTSEPTTSGTSSSTPSNEKRSPVSILNDKTLLGKKLYTCIEKCANPNIITAQLNVSLSSGENFILLTANVSTDKVNIAKRRIAHLALTYLFKEEVEHSDFDSDELLPSLPNDCQEPGNMTLFIDCKRKWKP